MHKVHRSKISVEKLMNQIALHSNVESTFRWTKLLTNRSSKEPSIAIQRRNFYENPFSSKFKELRISVALAETFFDLYLCFIVFHE